MSSRKFLSSSMPWKVIHTSSSQSPVHNSSSISIGRLTVLPCSSPNDENPVFNCSTSQYANRNTGRYRSQHFGLSWYTFKVDFRMLLILPHYTLDLRLCGVIRQLTFIILEVNWVPQLLSISLGNPTLLKT